MDIYKSYILNNGNRLDICHDEDMQSPREWDNVGKLCIREHRRYSFPNELDYDFDSAAEDAEILYNNYYIFDLDMYEHTGYSFSFSWQGMQCRFDTSSWIWFLAIPKGFDKLTGCNVENEAQAKEIATQELDVWNKYCNGEGYGFIEYKPVVWTSESGERCTEYESTNNSCRWYYEVEDILSEFSKYEPKEA